MATRVTKAASAACRQSFGSVSCHPGLGVSRAGGSQYLKIVKQDEMKLINIILLLVLVSFAVGQDPADRPVEIRNVDVAPLGEHVKNEVTLTQPVVPTLIVATTPDRLVLELPNTSSSAKQQRATVNQGGVKMVRIGLNSTNPPVTRVVLDLVEPRLYELATDGKKVTLTLLASETARQRRGGPVPAAPVTLVASLPRARPENLPATATSSALV